MIATNLAVGVYHLCILLDETQDNCVVVHSQAEVIIVAPAALISDSEAGKEIRDMGETVRTELTSKFP